MKSFPLFLLLSGLLCWSAATSAPAGVFLDESDPGLVAGLPPPPVNDSPAGRADLETLLQVQADRTPAQEARARRVAQHTPFLMGSAVFGDWFTAQNLPRTAEVLQTAWKESNRVSKRLKQAWDRPRPPARDARVHPCVKVPDDSSYPSGHSINATVWAAIFGAAFPEHAAEFEAQARETAWARVLGGAHFPSDTQAGRILSARIAERMLASKAMQQAVVEIRAEVAACRQQHAVPTP